MASPSRLVDNARVPCSHPAGWRSSSLPLQWNQGYSAFVGRHGGWGARQAPLGLWCKCHPGSWWCKLCHEIGACQICWTSKGSDWIGKLQKKETRQKVDQKAKNANFADALPYCYYRSLKLISELLISTTFDSLIGMLFLSQMSPFFPRWSGTPFTKFNPISSVCRPSLQTPLSMKSSGVCGQVRLKWWGLRGNGSWFDWWLVVGGSIILDPCDLFG